MERLARETFRQNRTLEFFSEKELTMQIGHSRLFWPIAILKELIDNALDACETAGVLPEIHISADGESLTVTDNGPGIPEKTIEQSLDYMIRVSDKNGYVSPSRGQLGNALKCVYAMPFVLNGDHGRVEIDTRGTAHRIEVSIDEIAQEPRLECGTEAGSVKNGALLKIYLSGAASYLEKVHSFFYQTSYFYQPTVYDLLLSYAAVNPHASFAYSGGFSLDLQRTVKECPKWTPLNPTCPHWYNTDRLASLIGGYLLNERGNGHRRTVRDFVGEFRGLSSTVKRKAVTEALGLSRSYLGDLLSGDSLDRGRSPRY